MAGLDIERVGEWFIYHYPENCDVVLTPGEKQFLNVLYNRIRDSKDRHTIVSCPIGSPVGIAVIKCITIHMSVAAKYDQHCGTHLAESCWNELQVAFFS